MTRSPTAAGSRPRGHSIQNGLVAAAIVFEFVLIIGHPLFGWGATTNAATPRALVFNAPQPPSGRAVLLALSAAAARQPAQVPTARTPYAYVHREEWRLAAPTGAESPPSTVSATDTESWLSSDGAGRVLGITRRAKGASTNDTIVARGHPLAVLSVLSSTPAALASRLGLGYPTAVPSARQFVAFTDLADSEPISPSVEAAILRLLASDPDVINSGTVTDRHGRPGVAVSVESAYTGVEILYTLVFDQNTGTLLEADQTLTGVPGKLDVAQGSVLAYTTFFASGYVARTNVRPLG